MARPTRPSLSAPLPRMARVNEVLREVLAEEIELVASSDPRLELVTVTGVACDPDLRHATVLLASLPVEAHDALDEARVAPAGGSRPPSEVEAHAAAQLRGRPGRRAG